MNFRPYPSNRRSAAFTMVEIAICLAIIGVALVAIIGVLPLGMNVQRDNREETVINQDATVLLESIRNGVRAGTDLTNYVFAITNYTTLFNNQMQVIQAFANGYTYDSAFIHGVAVAPGKFVLTNNTRIVGLLSTPEFTDNLSNPTNNLLLGGYSNHIVAYVRALSGTAVEKPPQDNQILIGDSFTYRILVVNAPQAVDTNLFSTSLPAAERFYNHLLAENLHELRLSFFWPVQPNGSIGTGRHTQRTMVAGTIVSTNDVVQRLYFYQSQSFANSP